MLTLTKGHKIIIVVVIGVILIGLGAYLLYREFSPKEQPLPTDIPIGGVAPLREIDYEVSPLTEIDVAKNEISNSAMLFAERFGTYSNQNDNSSFIDLQSMMTDSFYNWVNTQYQSKLDQEFANNGNYSAIVTEAVAIEFLTLSGDSAQVVVTTMRTKNALEQESISYEQEIRLDLKKINNIWRIDGAYWSTI